MSSLQAAQANHHHQQHNNVAAHHQALNRTTAIKSRKKLITIKPFVRPPQLPPDFYESTVGPVLECTRILLSAYNENSSSSRHNAAAAANLQQAYQNVQQLVSHHYGERFYQDIVKEFQYAVTAVLVVAPDDDSSAGGDEALLEHVWRRYSAYADYLSVVRQICLPLDNNSNYDLAKVGWQLFSQRLVALGMDTQLYHAWYAALWKDWKDCPATTSPLLGSIMSMWQQPELQIMSQPFFALLQPMLRAAWQQESEDWKTRQASPETFVQYVYQRWKRLSLQWTFLPRAWLRRELEHSLLYPHWNQDYIFKDMEVWKRHTDVLQILWMFAARLSANEGIPTLVQAIASYAKQEGLAALLLPSEKDMMDQLFQLQHSLLQWQVTLTASQPYLQPPLKQVWEHVLNQDSSRMAEALAKYVDTIMKQTKASFTTTSSLPKIDQVLSLFVHLQAKDVFEAFCKQFLAKRLLLNKVVSMDQERRFVSLLKAECGAGYTSKMEGMFQDVEWSRDTMAWYKAASAKSRTSSVEMEVRVLTTGYWPIYPQYELHLPPQLQWWQDDFMTQYKAKYQGRRMKWQFSLGQCTMTAQYRKSYDLILSLGLALVLLCFNTTDENNHENKERWTLPELQKAIGLDDRDEMERMLTNLSLGKYRLLHKWDHDAAAAAVTPTATAKSQKRKPRLTVDDRDEFTIQEDFHSNMRRIRIPTLAARDASTLPAHKNAMRDEERERTLEAVSRDRLYLVDAALVRILKARKTILHSQLIPQVLEQIKFPAQPAEIKLRIESLIEREYMERDAKDRNRYNYLA